MKKLSILLLIAGFVLSAGSAILLGFAEAMKGFDIFPLSLSMYIAGGVSLILALAFGIGAKGSKNA